MKFSYWTAWVAAILIGWMTWIPAHGQQTPGSASAGTTNSGPTGNYPGSGSSITNIPTAPPGTTPGQASSGAARTPPSGNYPGTGSGQQ